MDPVVDDVLNFQNAKNYIYTIDLVLVIGKVAAPLQEEVVRNFLVQHSRDYVCDQVVVQDEIILRLLMHLKQEMKESRIQKLIEKHFCTYNTQIIPMNDPEYQHLVNKTMPSIEGNPLFYLTSE
jgi:hypothetical protein